MRDGDPRLRRFADFLARAGLKATRQRTQIVRAFFGAGQHLSAEALYRQIYAQAPDIGLVTVYRTLKLLQEAGLATAHQFGESYARFDPSPADRPHSHLICTRCGKIQEFRDRGLRHLRQKVARGYGFAVGECKLERLLRTITDGPTRSITVLAREREVSAEIVSRMGQEPVRLWCTIPSASIATRSSPRPRDFSFAARGATGRDGDAQRNGRCMTRGCTRRSLSDVTIAWALEPAGVPQRRPRRTDEVPGAPHKEIGDAG